MDIAEDKLSVRTDMHHCWLMNVEQMRGGGGRRRRDQENRSRRHGRRGVFLDFKLYTN